MTKSNFLKGLSATAQFILGFVLGISLIAGISGAAVFLYYKRMSVLPKKPVFPEPTLSSESANNKASSSVKIEPLESDSEPIIVEDEKKQEKQLEKITTATSEEPETEEPETEEPEAELPPNAYRAVVTWPQGLSVRAEPNLNAGKVSGVSVNQTIIILEDSADGKWQRVRIPWSNQEGWVKAGNVKRTSY